MAKNKKNKKGIESYSARTVIVDIVMLILGLVFLVNAIAGKGNAIAEIFVRVIAGILIATGVFAIISFLTKQEKALFDWVVVIFGTAVMIFGIVFMVQPGPLISFLNWIMGMIIIVYSIVIIFTALAILKPARADHWAFSLFFGLAALVLGFLTIFLKLATQALVIMIGITLIVAAVGGIANAILALQAKKLAKKVIKADALNETAKDSGSEDKKDDDSLSDDVTNS